MDIKEAVLALDKANDNHWSQGGLPRLETVQLLTGDSTLTREQISAAYPNFTRNGVVEPQFEQAQSQELPPNVLPVEEPTPEFTVEQLDAYLADAQEALADAQRQLEHAKARIDECNRVCDEIIDARTVSQGHANRGDVISSYLRSQQKAYADRAEQLEKMKGIDLRALVPQRSALDRAISGRNLQARRQG